MASKITLNPDRKDNGSRQTESSKACSGLKRKDPDRQHIVSYRERSEWYTERGITKTCDSVKEPSLG